MAREGRGLITTIFKNLFNSLRPRSFNGKLIGKDHFGNSYYEITPPGHSSRQKPSRYFVPIGGEAKFDREIPPEWEAWLRLRRKSPPTDEEIGKNLAMIVQKKENALKIEEKFKPKLEAPEEPTTPALSKSYPKYDDYELYPGNKKKT